MAWVVEAGAQMLDTGIMVAPRVGLDELEEMFAGPERTTAAEWGLAAIRDHSWRDAALMLVSETVVECFLANWDNETIIAGFEKVLHKVIDLDLPVKVTGLVGGDQFWVASEIRDDHIAVRVCAPTIPATPSC